MPEPLKNVYSDDFILDFGRKVQAACGTFDAAAFSAAVLDETWDALPLKARTRRISVTLGMFLPSRYEAALDVLVAIADTCLGFPYLFFPDFVAVFGQAKEHWDVSMKALEIFTQQSSSEFAIRPFILSDPKRAMSQMTVWAGHPNEHVRRLSSEGCRPRLPWGESLVMFKADPTPVLAVLELLKEDPSLYVRKSVANNLNDITKDNPDMILDVARRWIGKHPHTDWIIRQGCRTLIRKGNPRAMALFGYADARDQTSLVSSAFLSVKPSVLTLGEDCEIRYNLTFCEGNPIHVRIEYGIDFIKANGSTSRKSFLISDKTVPGGTRLVGTRMHGWKELTTRRHHPGVHRIVLLVNGRETAETAVTLQSD